MSLDIPRMIHGYGGLCGNLRQFILLVVCSAPSDLGTQDGRCPEPLTTLLSTAGGEEDVCRVLLTLG